MKKDKKEKVTEQTEEKKKKYKKYWKILIVSIVVVVAIFAGIVAWGVYQAYQVANMTVYKPVIYLYPKEKTNVIVKLGNPEKLTCTYPLYNNGWEVVAKPDGTIIDINTNRELYSLYWEGNGTVATNMSEGFIVEGKDVISFLEEKLDILGLTNKEAEEFIIYWLPKLQNNKYNYIRFASINEINEYMPLELSIKADTVIRVLMQYKPLKEKIEVVEQKLETPKREGFTLVEWGGTEIK